MPDVNQLTKTPVNDAESRYPADAGPAIGLGEDSNQREDSNQKKGTGKKKPGLAGLWMVLSETQSSKGENKEDAKSLLTSLEPPHA